MMPRADRQTDSVYRRRRVAELARRVFSRRVSLLAAALGDTR